MRRDIQGGNFPLCPGLPQDVGKGGGARWRVERSWCQGMSHVKWKIWKMSPRWNVENVSRGEFLRQGGGIRWQGALTDITPPWVFRVDTVGEVWTTLQLWLHITTVFLLLQISSYYLTFAGQCSKRFQQSTFWWIHIKMIFTNQLYWSGWESHLLTECRKQHRYWICQLKCSFTVSTSHEEGKQVESLDDQVRELGARRTGNGSPPSPKLPRGHLGKAHRVRAAGETISETIFVYSHSFDHKSD